MDSERLEELLEKYWQCETSVEEEQQLQAYFRHTPVPEGLKETAALFRYFEAQKSKEVSDIAFEKSVLRRISAPRGRMANLIFTLSKMVAKAFVIF